MLADAKLAAELLDAGGRVLLFGDAGVGKSTLAAQLADAGVGPCALINANVGSPVAGPPGCAWRARRHEGRWCIEDLEALCTLDAGRYRLPLAIAVARLARRAPAGAALVEAPGVVRGTLAAELLAGLAEAANATAVVLITRDPELAPALVLPARVLVVAAAPGAVGASKPVRAAARTRLWDAYLDGAPVVTLPVPPAAGAELHEEDCGGRQVGLLDHRGRTLALGEVESMVGGQLRVRAPLEEVRAVRAMVLRDARRNDAGLLATARPNEVSPARGRAEIELAPDETSDMVAGREPLEDVATAPVSAHVASARVVLINGLLGDPTLHLRFRHHRRSLLFDIGDTARLQARIAHQISDLFVSHAHLDHIAGFLWLVRSRIGLTEACRVFGPPGIQDRIAGMVAAVEWDRVGDRGPVFDVHEIDGGRLRAWRLRAGAGTPTPLDPTPTAGLLLDEPGFQVRCVTLDHGGIPVLAFALEESVHLNVRKERLREFGVEPGPWLEALKHHTHAGELGRAIALPDGSERPVGELAGRLLLERAGEKVVYATDLGDTPENRDALVALARGAHTLFCEAGFADEHRDQAASTGHLTARACAEIAAAAGVGQLIPFHLSRRYEREPDRVLAEVACIFPATFVPPSLRAAVAARLR